MRRARRWIVASAVVLASRAALAAPPGRELDAAHRWFDTGIAAARTGDLAAARRAFGAAYALVPSVDILWNLASAERKLGDNVAALEHLRLYVASPEARLDRKKVAEDEMLPELESATAHLVIAQPDGASVVVDGRRVAASSTVDVLPGIHAVSIRRGGREQLLALDAPAGVLTHVVANAEIAPATVSPSGSQPAAPLAFDAREVGAAGRSPGRATAVISLGSAALLAIAGGVYFTIAAKDQQASADALQLRLRDGNLSCKRSGSLCDDYDSASSAASRDSALGTSLLVGGAVLSGAALASWVLWPAASTRVAPIAAKNGGGVSVMGSF